MRVKTLCSPDTHINPQTELRSAWMLLNLLIYNMIACMNIRLDLTTCASKTCQKMYTCTPMHIYMDDLNVHMYVRLHIDWLHRTLPVTQAASRGAISWSTESRLFTNIFDFVTSLISRWSSRQSHGSSEA